MRDQRGATTSSSREFDFAVSFAREQRSLARELSQLLAQSGAVVFYDSAHRARLLGRRLDREFHWIFGSGTRFFVPIVSSAYVDRTWPQLEWSIARREAKDRNTEYILPLRVDDSLLHGLHDSVAYLDLREHSLQDAAAILVFKLEQELPGYAQRVEEQAWVVAYGLVIQDLIESKELPSGVPLDYPRLCDWLTTNLLENLRSQAVKNPRFVEDARDGETLSVRIAFDWHPAGEPLHLQPPAWWEALELAPLSQIYPGGED